MVKQVCAGSRRGVRLIMIRVSDFGLGCQEKKQGDHPNSRSAGVMQQSYSARHCVRILLCWSLVDA